ncbi:MAG TPA: hypothetical protein VNM47_04870, partial [Terriglobia bacterium]|nr:hypothetical protein [Terriglobia bacterium]
MSSRREFLKTSALLSGTLGLIGSTPVFAAEEKPSGYFGVHPFVDQHPEAVFIMRTHVDHKTNSAACKQVGLELGRSLLVPMDSTGVPLTHTIAGKPNLTAHETVDKKRGLTLEDTMGITTDAYFVEGLFESLKELGVAGRSLNVRDTNGERVVGPRGYAAMGERTGATVLPVRNNIKTPDDANDDEAYVWKEVPGGVVSYQIPYLWPFNASDSWNLNMAKFKAHEMGLTLTAKNWQGSDARPFQQYCGNWRNIRSMQGLEQVIEKEVVNPHVYETLGESFKRHTQTIPRWNTPDFAQDPSSHNQQYYYNSMCMELWANRTIDNHSASSIGLHIVEGIYGRDGDFNWGPNPYGNENNFDGKAWDYMTNIVIFGRNPYLVDIVGHWLGGHEPGNFGLFHIAMERGKLAMMNPMNIPVYEWLDGVAVRRPLTGFTRTPLRTFYLQQREKETLWHLCNEPFDYSTVNEAKLSIPPKPTTRVLNQHYPNRNNPQLAI